MSQEFSVWLKRAVVAGCIMGTASVSAYAQDAEAPAATAPQIEASADALALFLADPAAFLAQEGDLAALIASVLLSDPSAADAVINLASQEGVTTEQVTALGAGLAQAAAQLVAEGNAEQGGAILAAVATSPSTTLATAFNTTAGDIATAAGQGNQGNGQGNQGNGQGNGAQPDTPTPGAPAASDGADDGNPATGVADIGGGDAAAGGTPATGAGVPGGNNAGGASGSTPGASGSSGSNAGGRPGGAVSPAG